MKILDFRFWILDWRLQAGQLRIADCGLRIVAATITVLLAASLAIGEARLDGEWIVVTGKGNTLETVAREVNNPAILSYDPEMGAATAARSFRIEGEMLVGGAPTTGTIYRYVNSLEFDIGQCGQARIIIENPKSKSENPKLVIENSRIGALRSDLGNDACKSEGNLIELAAGALVIRRGNIAGDFVVRANGGALEISDALVATTNHSGVALGNVASAKIAGLRSLDHKIYGMEIGPAEKPVALEQCTIRGGGSDLHVRGKSDVVMRDCDFDSIRFAGEGGSLRRQWTLTVRTPSAGCRVVAESEKGCALPETIAAAADTSGVARLVLTEYVARAGGLDYLRPGQNDSTPHRVTVRSADGKTVLGQIGRYRILTRGQEIRIP